MADVLPEDLLKKLTGAWAKTLRDLVREPSDRPAPPLQVWGHYEVLQEAIIHQAVPCSPGILSLMADSIAAMKPAYQSIGFDNLLKIARHVVPAPQRGEALAVLAGLIMRTANTYSNLVKRENGQLYDTATPRTTDWQRHRFHHVLAATMALLEREREPVWPALSRVSEQLGETQEYMRAHETDHWARRVTLLDATFAEPLIQPPLFPPASPSVPRDNAPRWPAPVRIDVPPLPTETPEQRTPASVPAVLKACFRLDIDAFRWKLAPSTSLPYDQLREKAAQLPMAQRESLGVQWAQELNRFLRNPQFPPSPIGDLRRPSARLRWAHFEALQEAVVHDGLPCGEKTFSLMADALPWLTPTYENHAFNNLLTIALHVVKEPERGKAMAALARLIPCTRDECERPVLDREGLPTAFENPQTRQQISRFERVLAAVSSLPIEQRQDTLDALRHLPLTSAMQRAFAKAHTALPPVPSSDHHDVRATFPPPIIGPLEPAEAQQRIVP